MRKRFCNMFLRAPQAAGLNCSCHAAQASTGNFQKTCYTTFSSTCRPRRYFWIIFENCHTKQLVTISDFCCSKRTGWNIKMFPSKIGGEDSEPLDAIHLPRRHGRLLQQLGEPVREQRRQRRQRERGGQLRVARRFGVGVARGRPVCAGWQFNGIHNHSSSLGHF